MNNDKDREEEQLDLNVDDDQGWQSRERLFDDFDDSDEPEDDRDTDHNVMFSEVDAEDELEEDEPDYFDDLPEDNPEEPAAEVTDRWDDAVEQDDPWESTEEGSPSMTPTATPLPPVSPTPSEEPEWEDDPEDDNTEYYEDEEREITLPLGLILVGLVALILLGAGGYGVMQQRAEMQEEIRRLQSNLATAANPSEVSETRANNEALVELNADLEAELELLTAENRSLQAIVAGLEKQLAAQQDAMVQPAPTPKPAAPSKPAPKPVARQAAAPQPAAPKPAAPKPAAPKPAAPKPVSSATAQSGTWFVNFGSYSQEETARGWSQRLEPGAGEVVVITGEKAGRTFYRVRVINLQSKEQADSTARTLETRYDLPKLWVGQSD